MPQKLNQHSNHAAANLDSKSRFSCYLRATSSLLPFLRFVVFFFGRMCFFFFLLPPAQGHLQLGNTFCTKTAQGKSQTLDEMFSLNAKVAFLFGTSLAWSLLVLVRSSSSTTSLLLCMFWTLLGIRSFWCDCQLMLFFARKNNDPPNRALTLGGKV